MRILIQDYSGHPFQVQLSRALAKRGHCVRHIFCASFQTPRGNITKQPDDPENFDIRSVSLDEPFQKDAFLKRRRQEIEIGNLIAAEIKAFTPEIVISSNAPLDTQRMILAQTRRSGAKFIFWLQDVYSEAIRRLLPKKLPIIGEFVGMFYQLMEYKMLRNSDHVVSIADDFVPLLKQHHISPDKITVIENWAPLGEIVPVNRDNEWSKEHMPHPGLRVVYSGTLGYKHNPQLLIDVARVIDGNVYVFSEGTAADGLKVSAAAQGVQNISVQPWVPFEKLSHMLSGADLFVAIIEPEAGIFSVPSKVLSYLCVGRPIIGFIPEGNLARKIIERVEAGIVGDPQNPEGVLERLQPIFKNEALRLQMGKNARDFAEKTFDIEEIAGRFENVFERVR